MSPGAVCFLVFALPGLLIGQDALPTPSELIARAVAARNAQDAKHWKYTFREDHEQSELDKNGQPSPPSTKMYEQIMLEGDNYRKLILIDGKPPDAKTQKKIDQDLEKTRSELQKNGRFSLHRTISLGGLDLLERIFNNKVTGEETVLGRKTWRMESEPKPGYKAADKQEDEAVAVRKISWFDREDGYRIKESSVFFRAANGYQPGTTVDLEWVKIGEEWLPGNATVRADIKALPGVHGRVESKQRYYDYKRFIAESTITPQ